MIRRITSFTAWFFIWLLLTWPPERHDIVTAFIVSAFVLFMTIDILSESPDGYSSAARKAAGITEIFRRILWFLYYIIIFIWEFLKAGVDIACRVLGPDLPIKPGTVKVKTLLRSDIALTFLANSITLAPGTTTVDIDKDGGYIYIHRLNIKDDFDGSIDKLPIVDKFEKILTRIFE